MSEALNWSYRTTDIPDAGLKEIRTATQVELAALTAALEVLSCDQLTSDFVIRGIGGGRFRLAGTLSAQLTQSCVVTLEPIQQTVEGSFDVEFSPVGNLPESTEDEIEALGAAEIEPIEHGRIDAGRIVFETLSAAVNPYPRKSGAAFETDADDSGAAGQGGPFAALKILKDRG